MSGFGRQYPQTIWIFPSQPWFVLISRSFPTKLYANNPEQVNTTSLAVT
jgi:hypothetical protein